MLSSLKLFIFISLDKSFSRCKITVIFFHPLSEKKIYREDKR